MKVATNSNISSSFASLDSPAMIKSAPMIRNTEWMYARRFSSGERQPQNSIGMD